MDSLQLHSHVLPNHKLYKQNFQSYATVLGSNSKIQYSDEEIYPLLKTLLASDGAGGWGRIRVLLLEKLECAGKITAKGNGRQNHLDLCASTSDASTRGIS